MCFLNFTHFYVKNLTTKTVLFSNQSKDGLYVLSESYAMSIHQVYWSPCVSASANIWHNRLGHRTSCVFHFFNVH